jgi:hypothetical protein
VTAGVAPGLPANNQGHMMRFLVTMNMPSYSNNLVHQMIVEHKSKSLDEFVDALANEDFVIVEEFYRNPHDNNSYSRGHVALNHRFVGKVKVIGSNRDEE